MQRLLSRMNKDKITKDLGREFKNSMAEAFLCGCGYGQALLEQDMDNNFFDAFLQYSQTQKDMNVNHQVQIPNTIVEEVDKNGKIKIGKDGYPILKTVLDWEGKYVRYKLRSNKWREAMFAEKEKFEKEVKKVVEKIKKL